MLGIILTVVAVIGLVIFAVGAGLFLASNPAQPRNTLLMVVGGLIFAIAEVILNLIALLT